MPSNERIDCIELSDRKASTFSLHDNYQNPFNPTKTLKFDLPTNAIVTLKVYSRLGQEVIVLLDRARMHEGSQQVKFDANKFAPGVYYYRIFASGEDSNGVATGATFTQLKRMLLLR